MEANISDIVGVIFESITGMENDSEEIIFTANDGRRWRMIHYQDCCESVYIEDVCGDVNDLLDTPILAATETTSDQNPAGLVMEYQDSSFTWTFYEIRTIKGTVTIRWYGESNGYYSEAVYFQLMAG